MRILKNLFLSLLIVCGLAAVTNAGCPHCQAIVKVTIELNDGSSRHGYFEYHQDDLPSVTKADGRVTIPHEKIPTDFYKESAIRLLDTVVVIPGLGLFSSLSDIDSIAVVDIKQMALESNLTKFSAQRVHFIGASEIKLLSSPELTRFDTTIDLSTIHYISLNDSVTVTGLKLLARKRLFAGAQQDQLLNVLLFGLRHSDWVHDSLFTEHLIAVLEIQQRSLLAMQLVLDSLTGRDIVGQHFAVVSGYVAKWKNFFSTLLIYLKDDDRQPLDAAILKLREENYFPDDIDVHPYKIDGSVNRQTVTHLINLYVQKSKVSDKLGKDYYRHLNAHQVYIFEQAFD